LGKVDKYLSSLTLDLLEIFPTHIRQLVLDFDFLNIHGYSSFFDLRASLYYDQLDIDKIKPFGRLT